MAFLVAVCFFAGGVAVLANAYEANRLAVSSTAAAVWTLNFIRPLFSSRRWLDLATRTRKRRLSTPANRNLADKAGLFVFDMRNGHLKARKNKLRTRNLTGSLSFPRLAEFYECLTNLHIFNRVIDSVIAARGEQVYIFVTITTD